MNKKQITELATKITDDLFELGGELGEPCGRIAFKGGVYPKEREHGGLCRESFRRWLCEALDKHTQKGA